MIAIDWGTSSFRAYRIDASGSVIEQRGAAAGLLSCNGEFEAVLTQQIAGWDDDRIVMSGMIGSRSGWFEVPYVDSPASAADIVAGTREVTSTALPGRRIRIAPGLKHQPPGAAPEVMRGEETQLLGLLATLGGTESLWVCLPGTHSKWARVENGRVVSFLTAMTGELYALLRRHSLLAALMPQAADADIDCEGAFSRGVAASAGGRGLLQQLFGVRTQGLFGMLTAAQAPSYLSGLLIGHELRAWLADLPARGGTVHLVGGARLLRLYERALSGLGIASRSHAETLTAQGLYTLARMGGFDR